MPAIASIINAPALFLRVFLNVSTVAAVIGVVAAGISVGVVVAKILANQSQDGSTIDPFHETTVIFQSLSSLAFNRVIQSYELDDYYNATETLLDLVEQLNDHLKDKFPNNFIEAVISAFSTKPQLDPSLRRKRRDNDYNKNKNRRQFASNSRRKREDPPCMDLNRCHTPGITTNTPLTTTFPLTSTTLPIETSDTSPPEKTTQTDTTDMLLSTNFGFFESTSERTPPPTSLGTPDFDTTPSTTSQSSITSTDTSSKISSTQSSSSFSFSTSTIQGNNASNCSHSMFNGTSQTSIIYINGTLYFNTTENNIINPIEVIDSLKSFNPIIVLADRCLIASPAESTFNATLSIVQPPSLVQGDITFLNNNDTIPSSLLNQTNSIISPVEAAQLNATVTIITGSTMSSSSTTTSATTATSTTIAPVTTTTTQSTTQPITVFIG